MRIWIPRWASALMLDESDSRPRVRSSDSSRPTLSWRCLPRSRRSPVACWRILPETPKLQCLTLLATVGEQAEWNVRDQSIGHQAIPLPSEEIVARAPMISQPIRQLGLEIHTIIRPEPSILIDAT